MSIKANDRVKQSEGLTGTVISTATGTAETDGRFYAGKLLAFVRWDNGAFGRWPAEQLERMQ